MTSQQLITEFERYESELARIHASFVRPDGIHNGIYIGVGDDSRFRQYAQELEDLYNDALGPNPYSGQIAAGNQSGLGHLGLPSLKDVDYILGVVRASLTRFRRNPAILDRRQTQEALRKKENVFLIHGRAEAKWRELKEIVQDFRLNPIALAQQPDAGAETVIAKFERYAESCSFAIAVFTPDDEVTSGGESYLQARPNVIYELGWFCGRLGRSNVILLLQDGTSMFSDFGGIIQKRFTSNISERSAEIRKDLIAAGVIPQV